MPETSTALLMPEAQQSLGHAQQRWQCYFQQGNATALATLYAETGQIRPADSVLIRGRSAIAAFWQGCFDMGLAAMVRTPSTIDWPCDSANEVGDYHLRNRHGQLVDVGKYVTVWKAHQGQWQIQCDRWTSNLPEPFATGEWFDSKG